MTQGFAGLQEGPVKRLGTGLQHKFDEFHPSQHAPSWHMLGRQDLMLVIPFARVELDDLPLLGQAEERRPAMRRDIQHLDLVRIVRQQLLQPAPVIAIGFFLEAHHPGCHGQDAMAPQKSDRLAIDGGGRALADHLQGLFVGVLKSQEKTLPAGLFVEMQNIGIANDVVGAG